jgi:hypothetical protein
MKSQVECGVVHQVYGIENRAFKSIW